MTLSGILIWFAERKQDGTPQRVVLKNLGAVQHDLDHLVHLGLLNCYVRVQDKAYTLKNYPDYQVRRAA